MVAGGPDWSLMLAQQQLVEIRTDFEQGWTTWDGTCRPLVRGLLSDFAFAIESTTSVAYVLVEFSVEQFPGVRFVRRFPPHGPGNHDSIAFMEDIECGLLDLQMRGVVDPPRGVIWTSFGYSQPEPR